MLQSENSAPTENGALGFYSVLIKVYEPILESIFWLALGGALGWQDKECVVCINNRTVRAIMPIYGQERSAYLP